jgi:hypothetical protein
MLQSSLSRKGEEPHHALNARSVESLQNAAKEDKGVKMNFTFFLSLFKNMVRRGLRLTEVTLA